MHHIEYSVCAKLNFETPQINIRLNFFLGGGVLIEGSIVAHDIVSLLFDRRNHD